MPLLEIGDPAPWFSIAASNNPLFDFSMAGGRRVVLFFFARAAFEQIQALLNWEMKSVGAIPPWLPPPPTG